MLSLPSPCAIAGQGRCRRHRRRSAERDSAGQAREIQIFYIVPQTRGKCKDFLPFFSEKQENRAKIFLSRGGQPEHGTPAPAPLPRRCGRKPAPRPADTRRPAGRAAATACGRRGGTAAVPGPAGAASAPSGSRPAPCTGQRARRRRRAARSGRPRPRARSPPRPGRTPAGNPTGGSAPARGCFPAPGRPGAGVPPRPARPSAGRPGRCSGNILQCVPRPAAAGARRSPAAESGIPHVPRRGGFPRRYPSHHLPDAMCVKIYTRGLDKYPISYYDREYACRSRWKGGICDETGNGQIRASDCPA